MKGSMELLADRDPEEARALLDPVLERMIEAVHRYEGTVNQVMGDGIMALFGAPLAHEDHAVRACYAALRMQERDPPPTARTLRRAQGVEVQIRVGPELRRGRRALDRQRPAHGLHGGRADHAPRRAHGAARHAGHDPPDRGDAAARRGVRAGLAARAHPGARARGARRGLRADRRRAGAHPAAGGAGARAHALRGPRRGDGADPSRRRAGGAGAGADRRGRRRAGGRQVAALRRVHPLACWRRPGSCSSRARFPTAGDAVPAVADLLGRLLPDRRSRRRAERPRRWRARSSPSIARSRTRCRRCVAPRRPRAPRRVSRARAGAAPPARARRRQARPAPREPRAARCSLLFEDLHWIDTETQARARQPGREPARPRRVLLA